MMLTSRLVTAFVACAPCFAAQSPCETFAVHYPDSLGDESDNLGRAVDSDGGIAVIGVPGHGADLGRVVVMERREWGWEEVQILQGADQWPGDRFGTSLALEGDTLVVGAPEHGELSAKGAAYVFERQLDGLWLETQRITSSDPKVWVLGSAVAIGDGQLAIGARSANTIGDGSGRVLFFEHEAGVWNYLSAYSAPEPIPGDQYGETLAMDGSWLIVGSSQRFALASLADGGLAYVYEHMFLGWVPRGVLASSDAADHDGFGIAVAISGSTALVGATGQGIQNNGAVYVFDRAGNSWSETAKLQPHDVQPIHEFGHDIDIDGDRAVIGAWHDDDPELNIGAAYVFEREAGVWTETAKFQGSQLIENDTFGHSGIHLAGDELWVGAPSAAVNHGSAYHFSFQPGPNLTADTGAVSLSAGGAQSLHLSACPAQAGDFYALAGTVTGTSPGFAFGGLAVPLNPDFYFFHTVSQLGAPPLGNAFGTLDAYGTAQASFELPVGVTPPVGLVLHHAYLVLDAVTLAPTAISPAIPVAIEP